MNFKHYHKSLKKQVNEIEEIRNNDRTSYTWYQLKELKKQKLKAKEKLNETKQ
jgi:uncharacterized protein YdcH (DUF465 family)